MKKLFYLFLFFFVLTFCSQAQIKKGSILLGGDVGFSSQKSENYAPDLTTKQTSINLAPSIGKAIKDNLVAGIDLTFWGAKTTQNDGNPSGQITNTIDQHNYGLGFFLRQYKPLGSGFSIFMQGRLGAAYNIQKNKFSNVPAPTMDQKGYNIDLGFYPGIAYAVTKRIQLETGFQNLVYAEYDHSRTTNPSLGSSNVTLKSSSFKLGTGLSNSLSGFVIGFRVLLGA